MTGSAQSPLCKYGRHSPQFMSGNSHSSPSDTEGDWDQGTNNTFCCRYSVQCLGDRQHTETLRPLGCIRPILIRWGSLCQNLHSKHEAAETHGTKTKDLLWYGFTYQEWERIIKTQFFIFSRHFFVLLEMKVFTCVSVPYFVLRFSLHGLDFMI